VGEMENRYNLMASLGVRNITGYNKKVREAQALLMVEMSTDIKWIKDTH